MKMNLSVEQIPAFPMWKMLSDTIPALLNNEYPERRIQHLVNIMKSNALCDLLVYGRDPNISFDCYQKIIGKYQIFTTWLLGQFFYLSIRDKFKQIHEIAIDAQISILRQLGRTQAHVFQRLSDEYFRILEKIVENLRLDKNKMQLAIFVPDKDEELEKYLELNAISPMEISDLWNVIMKILQIIKFLLFEQFSLENFDGNDLFYLLRESTMEIKLIVIEIFTEISRKLDSNNEFIQSFHSHFYQVVYEVYYEKLTVDNCLLGKFHSLLRGYMKNSGNLDGFFVEEFLNGRQLDVEIIGILSGRIQVNSIKNSAIFLENFMENSNPLHFKLLKNVILNDLSNEKSGKFLLDYGLWQTINLGIEKIFQYPFQKMMTFLNELAQTLIEIQMETGKYIIFLKETQFFPVIIDAFDGKTEENLEIFLRFLTNFLMISDMKNIKIIYDIIIYPLIKSNDSIVYHHQLSNLWKKLEIMQFDKNICWKYARIFLINANIKNRNIPLFQKIQKNFNNLLETFEFPLITLSGILDLINVNKILEIVEQKRNNEEILQILPELICTLTTNYQKNIIYQNYEPKITIICQKNCTKYTGNTGITMDLPQIQSDMAPIYRCLEKLLETIQNDEINLKLLFLQNLVHFHNHLPEFQTVGIATKWLPLCADDSPEVRKQFAQIIKNIPINVQNNPDFYHLFYENLNEITKKSLIHSDYQLQTSILDYLYTICDVKQELILLPTLRIILYMLMLPTSKYSLLAVNRFNQLAKTYGHTSATLFHQYRLPICEKIIDICIINRQIIDYNLSKSLGKIASVLEYYNVKNFVIQESTYLLPYLVAGTINVPICTELIHEMAQLSDTETSELLATHYGTIFLHLFLNYTKDEFKKCMIWIEGTTHSTGPVLRKNHFRVILNELLLNFGNCREKVLLALTLLAKEDEQDGVVLQDYIAERFFGSLQHFDAKLTTSGVIDRRQIYHSLAALFEFMGGKRVAPFRFKIIAMLRTVNVRIDEDAMAISAIWCTFLKCCDLEQLAPQLATIVLSLLPLHNMAPLQINECLNHLIITNELVFKDYLMDLFFLKDDPRIETTINDIIIKRLEMLAQMDFIEKIQMYLKYLTHETVEMRTVAMRQLRQEMAAHREELDRLILGYNGIHSSLVELIEMVTLCCRDKDNALRLACGELVGELGAVEPSHLPRKYAQNGKSLPFFMTDDDFAVGILNELTRAIQSEKNTLKMDRFALAIQECLKFYAISPDSDSTRNHIWRQFNEAQQQVMLPLLSSHYMTKQTLNNDYPSPIYGTTMGSTFNSWLYNWTCSLISGLPTDLKNLTRLCLPAIKHERILMNFLPHLVVHYIINSSECVGKAYKELSAVIDCNSEKIANCKLFSISRSVNCETNPIDDTTSTESMKTVFLILDFLDRWTRDWRWKNGKNGITDTNYITIRNFLDKFCKLRLAQSNYYCGQYPRALLLLEEYISANPDNESEQFNFLAEIYAELDEPDGVSGAFTLQPNDLSIEQRILALEVEGKLSDVIACYEQMAPPLQYEHVKGLVRCYLDLDDTHTALNLVLGAYNQPHLDFTNALNELHAETLWRLGRYDDLHELLDQPELQHNNSWGVQIGMALLSFQRDHRTKFGEILNSAKLQQMELFAATNLEFASYRHGYQCIVRLHALNELERIANATYELLIKPNDRIYIESIVKNLKNEWELRLKVVQESMRTIEPLLCLRRAALDQSRRLLAAHPTISCQIDALIGDAYLISAKMARKTNAHQQAYIYTMRAEFYAPPSLFVEKAKLHWLRDEHAQALDVLKRGITRLANGDPKALPLDDRRLCANAKLLYASYNDSISNVDTETNITNYKEAVDCYKEWEKSFLYLAQFYDRFLTNLNDDDQTNDNKRSDIQIYMINYFGKSLLYGTNHVYESLPRLLSIWFDYGARLTANDERRTNLMKMTRLVDSFVERLPAYIFLTAFSQLVSRICHPQREVYIQLKSIIIKLLLTYPQQTLWMIISIERSSYAMCTKRYAEIMNDTRIRHAPIGKFVKDFTQLAEKLIELCNKDLGRDVRRTTVSQLVRTLPRLLAQKDFSEIMIPTQRLRKLILPNPDLGGHTQHNPFPNRIIHIIGIEEEVHILHSLQKPRKITFKCSDGCRYIQMLKPKDDLRKDFRLMEFNDVVNQLLIREPRSRDRRLMIRLYSVVPLNEECGMIEWVPNLMGFRPILMSIYEQMGIVMKSSELRAVGCNLRDSLAKKREIFLTKLLPRHPSVLNEWFRHTFPDAQSWLMARTAYIRTTAVISMVGYVLGLGDRHGENIQLDATCGDTVHVDFNCLFNKGETFEWPERVPFRLTHNMASAMGPLGVEGVFRKACACTLHVLRANTSTLMSIVTPFVYDPLVDWSKNTTTPPQSERTNEQARDHIKNIEMRLQGIVKTRGRLFSAPLSVEGQTNNLINEATSIDNLCQMFIGWGAYL